MELTQALNDAVAKVTEWVEALVRSLPEIAAATLIVVVFAVLARVVRGLVRQVTGHIIHHASLQNLAATSAYIGVWTLGLVLALGVLELDRTVTSVLAGVGIVGIALGFAFQDIAANFVSGILLNIRRPFTEGDLVETNGFFGHIERIDLRATRLRTLEGQLVLIPNKSVFGEPITNYSAGSARRMDLRCGVTYGEDLEKACSIALEAMEGVVGSRTDREAELFYEEFGGSSINFVLRLWLEDSSQITYLRARSDAVIRLKKAFDANDVSIPFPIMTLDFSDSGTRLLDEPLSSLRQVS